MTRLSAIEIDQLAETAQPPEQWTPDWVRCRLVEAYAIQRRMPGGERKGNGSAWPTWRYDFADVVAWHDWRERATQNWDKASNVLSFEVSRCEEAHEWLRTILAQHPLERTCLAHWATAIAYRHSLRALMVRRRWSRTSFYKAVNVGSQLIAAELHKSGVSVR